MDYKICNNKLRFELLWCNFFVTGRDFNIEEARWTLHNVVTYANEMGLPSGQDLDDIFIETFSSNFELYPNLKLVFLEAPPISTKHWNHINHPNWEVIYDSVVARHVETYNEVIKIFNTNPGNLSSLKFSLDLLKSPPWGRRGFKLRIRTSYPQRVVKGN